MEPKESPARRASRAKAIKSANKRKKEVPAKVIAIAERLEYAEKHVEQPLTNLQQKFIRNVIDNGMAPVPAARAAGCSNPKDAAKRFGNSLAVQRTLEKERERAEKVSLMTKKRVMDGFLEAVDISRVLGDPVAMTGAWREIAKMCGYYEPTRHKLEVSVDGQVVIQKLQQLDDEELLKLADGNAEALDAEFQVIQKD